MGLPAEIKQGGVTISKVFKGTVHGDHLEGSRVEIRDNGSRGAAIIFFDETTNMELKPGSSQALDSGVIAVGTKD